MSEKKKCCVCGKDAEVYIKLIKSDQTVEKHYCLEHAEESGVLQDTSYALLEEGDEILPPVGEATNERCPSCGFSLRDWKKSGRFGCAHCYGTFEEKIQPALERLHSDTVHRGKIPRQAYNPVLIANRIKDLQKQLENAVKEERFEDAAATRDEMSTLKSFQFD
ncbi:MAG: UvrB/UvrC motif-containing protein [Verrucomicrobiota bacterium]